MDLLNLGGGFSCDAENYNVKENNFDLVAPRLSKHLDQAFPDKDL